MTIHGHKEFANKACPCFEVKRTIQIYNKLENIIMWKTILTKGSLWLIIGVLSFSLWQTYTSATKYQQKADSLETTISDLNQQIQYAKIQLNDSISVYQAEVKNLCMTQNNLQSRYDKLLAASKIKPRDVGNVTEVATIVHSVDTIIAEVDTFGGLSAKLDDKFVNIDVSVLPDRHTIIDYEIRDSLTLFNIQKALMAFWINQVERV